ATGGRRRDSGVRSGVGVSGRGAGATAATRSRGLPGVTTQIFIGLLLGIAVGDLAPSFGLAVRPLADAFLRLIKMSIAPLLFATFVGIALAAIGAKGKPVIDVLEATAQAMFRVTGYVMRLAPFGVFAAIAATVGGKGLAILLTLGKLVGIMYLGLVIFVLVVV